MTNEEFCNLQITTDNSYAKDTSLPWSQWRTVWKERYKELSASIRAQKLCIREINREKGCVSYAENTILWNMQAAARNMLVTLHTNRASIRARSLHYGE